MNFDADMMEKSESWGRCKICDEEGEEGEEEGEKWQAQIWVRISAQEYWFPHSLLIMHI